MGQRVFHASHQFGSNLPSKWPTRAALLQHGKSEQPLSGFLVMALRWQFRDFHKGSVLLVEGVKPNLNLKIYLQLSSSGLFRSVQTNGAFDAPKQPGKRTGLQRLDEMQ